MLVLHPAGVSVGLSLRASLILLIVLTPNARQAVVLCADRFGGSFHLNEETNLISIGCYN